MINRRNILQGMAAGVALGSTSLGKRAQGSERSGLPKRVIFFLQNQGFDPATCVPAGMKESGSLPGVELPEPISPLEPYKNKLHIITGLHGRHTSPSTALFSALLAGTEVVSASRRLERQLIM